MLPKGQTDAVPIYLLTFKTIYFVKRFRSRYFCGVLYCPGFICFSHKVFISNPLHNDIMCNINPATTTTTKKNIHNKFKFKMSTKINKKNLTKHNLKIAFPLVTYWIQNITSSEPVDEHESFYNLKIEAMLLFLEWNSIVLVLVYIHTWRTLTTYIHTKTHTQPVLNLYMPFRHLWLRPTYNLKLYSLVLYFMFHPTKNPQKRSFKIQVALHVRWSGIVALFSSLPAAASSITRHSIYVDVRRPTVTFFALI